MGRTFVIAAAALIALPLVADAQSYRCVGKDGKRYYGSIIPSQCTGLVVEQLSRQGTVIKRIDPEGEMKERLAKEAAQARKREDDALARETMRRDNALLATYTSEKDIEQARARALAENEKALRLIESRVETTRKRHAGYEKDFKSYKGNNKPPARLAEDLDHAGQELSMQQASLEAKKNEVAGINAKFDQDKKRYVELTGKR